MGNSWPLHWAHPFGAKLKPKILISATNGSDIRLLLILRWEYSLQRDNKVEHQIGRHILVRLTATYVSDGLRRHGHKIRRGIEVNLLAAAGPHVSRGTFRRRCIVSGLREVEVLGQLWEGQRMGGFAACLPLIKAVADVNWHATLKIRQRKVYPPVSAVHR